MFSEIGGGLTGKWWDRCSDPLPSVAMAGGACCKAPLRVALMKKTKAVGRLSIAGVKFEASIIGGHSRSLGWFQRLRNPSHLRVISATFAVILKLPLQITGIQTCKPRRTRAIAASVQSVAGKAGIARTRIGAAQRDQPPACRQTVERAGLGRAAGAQQGAASDKEVAHRNATARSWHLFPLAAVALAACKPPPEQRQFMPVADSARGKVAIERVGCASCHTIPGIRWPQGKAGPALNGLGERALIAGKLPNRPDLLTAYIRNAPALVADSGMPAMPVSAKEANDIAAYLYEQGTD